MHECLLCKRDMKTAKTIFGNGCLKNIYKLLDLKFPKNVKDRESYLIKNIMKKLNIKCLNAKQKVWLADRYLTYQYVDNLKYGDYTELKNELSEDIENVEEIVEISEFKTAEKIELKQAYILYRKEEKFERYLNKLTYMKDTAKVGLRFALENSPINLIIKRNTHPFEISAIKNMQYALWQVVAIGGNIVRFDSSAELLEHSLTNNPKDILITEGKIVEEIKNDAQFKNKIDDIVKKYDQKGMNEFVTNPDESSIVFDNSDLYFALHKSDMCITGKKKNDKWDLVVELSDQYDYTDFKELDDYYNDANSVPKSMFSSFIYNLAFFSVKFGVIKEYQINIKFNIDNYEVN